MYEYGIVDSSGQVTIVRRTDSPIGQVSLHHIIPLSKIREIVQNAVHEANINATQDSLKTILSDMINQPPIQNTIESLMSEQRPDWNDGMILAGAVLWNPANLVPGPNPPRRQSDPKDSLDTKICNRQQPHFQNAVNDVLEANKSNQNIDSLDYFTKLPPADPVMWKRNEHAKYSVH